jgi:FecR protein
VPTLPPIGRQRGKLAPLLAIPMLWINGCQSVAPRSEGGIGSDIRWTITRQVGPASLRSPGQSFWQRATPGAILTPGSQVATFDGTRLELASVGDQVTASGPCRFTLPNAEHDGVQVRQDAGSVRYEVQSAPKRHFEVQTPHFSTVVKGTTFLVSIDRASSQVFVGEGRVLILDPNGEPLAELNAGQTGRLAAHPGATLEVSTASGPSFEGITAPGGGYEPSGLGNTAFPNTTRATRVSLAAPANDAGEAATPSLLERIVNVFSVAAASISPGDDALATQGARLGSDQGGGGSEQEGLSSGSSTLDGTRGSDNSSGVDQAEGHGKGKGRGHGKGKGKGKGHAGGKGKGNGHGKGKGHGHGRGLGGRGASVILEHDRPLVAWNGHR